EAPDGVMPVGSAAGRATLRSLGGRGELRGNVARDSGGQTRRTGPTEIAIRTGVAVRRRPLAARPSSIAPRRSPVRVRLAPFRLYRRVSAFGFVRWGGSDGRHPQFAIPKT